MENVERDRRIIRNLEHLGWRILVVWECELTKKTVETINRVTYWLSQGKIYYNGELTQYELLSVAEEKIRYRISSYDNEPELNKLK